MTEQNPPHEPQDPRDAQAPAPHEPAPHDADRPIWSPPQPPQDQPAEAAPGSARAWDEAGTEHTHRFEQLASFGAPAQAPAPQGRRLGNGLVAMLASGALVVGLVGGVAGAAAFGLVDGNDSSATRTVTNSTVADNASSDTPAADGSAEQVAKAVLPSVVKINVAGQQGSGSGSGIVLSSDGEILTNDHVVEVAAGGGTVSVSFNDGTSAKATVVGTDPTTDLAVIKAQGVTGLTPATLGSSDAIDVGEPVVAIGSPFGLAATVTSGIVSALNRPVSVGDPTSTSSQATTYPAIQTDAAINPGNSGGPLVNMQAQVVGINSSIRTASSSLGSEEGGSIGLGFAIPISKVLPVVDQLRNGETPTHARLGVTVGSASEDNGTVTGASIQTVNQGSAADEAGLKSGDLVTRVDDEVITDSDSLVATIRGHRPGDRVKVTYERGGDTRTATVTLDSDEGASTS